MKPPALRSKPFFSDCVNYLARLWLVRRVFHETQRRANISGWSFFSLK